MPVYILGTSIFAALRITEPGKGGEIQLTDAIHGLIETGKRVQAIRLNSDEMRPDIGTPEIY
jgi:UTP--glucose-1-phosphate uridylyltransferase